MNREKNFYAYKPLTKVELETIDLYSRGFTGQEVAKELFMAHSSIDKVKQRVLAKVCAKTTAHAISILFRIGVLK